MIFVIEPDKQFDSSPKENKMIVNTGTLSSPKISIIAEDFKGGIKQGNGMQNDTEAMNKGMYP